MAYEQRPLVHSSLHHGNTAPTQHNFGPPLTPIHALPGHGSEPYTGRPLPPMQLPPILSSASPPPAATSKDPNHTMSVTSLLSKNPDSPKRPQRAPRSAEMPNAQPQYQHQIQQQYSSPPGPYESALTDGRGMLPSRQHLPPAHYMDQPPRQSRAPPPPPTFPAHQYEHPRMRHPSTGADSDAAHRSPATSHAYSPSRYANSSEASPTSAYAPSYPMPPQPRISQPPALNYALTIRQQPAAARACGYGERDRRVIDPPPILELKTTSKASGAPEIDLNGMLALHCTLLNRDGFEDETEVPQAQPDGPASRRLMGSLVAAPYQAKDENGTAGTFFVFPDLSCRNPGKYRLKFTLIRIDPTNMAAGSKHPTVAHVMTDLFSVYTAKDFPGMRASSALLKALRRQGLNVGVKKGSEARKGKGKAKKGGSSDEEEDDSDGSEQEGGRKPSTASGATDESGEVTSPKAKKNKKGRKRRRDSQ